MSEPHIGIDTFFERNSQAAVRRNSPWTILQGRTVAESILDDLARQDCDYGGEHEGRYELQAGCRLHRSDKPRAEEVRREDDREVDERHERAEERSEEQCLHGG